MKSKLLPHMSLAGAAATDAKIRQGLTVSLKMFITGLFVIDYHDSSTIIADNIVDSSPGIISKTIFISYFTAIRIIKVKSFSEYRLKF